MLKNILNKANFIESLNSKVALLNSANMAPGTE